MKSQGRVGSFQFVWRSIPQGKSGSAQVEVNGQLMDVRYRRDIDGIWIETPRGAFGYDVRAHAGDEGTLVYDLSERGGHRFWKELAYVRAGEEQAQAAAGGARKGVRVRAQMPGKILRVHVKAGDAVEKGQPLLVMEAMKMENEIRATQGGKIGKIHVKEGQTVETGADLCVIDA